MSINKSRPIYGEINITLKEIWGRTNTGKDNECWEWKGMKRRGYGAIERKGKAYGVHRVVWVLHHNKPIPKGMIICHTCDNPPCVNPSHLYCGTPKDNMHDKVRRGRQASNPRPDLSCAKLTGDEVVQLRNDYATGEYRYRDLSNRYGISEGAVSRCVRGLTYKRFGGAITPDSKHLMGRMNQLTEEQVVQIRNDYASGKVSMRQLAKKYGRDNSAINLIVKGDTYKRYGGAITMKRVYSITENQKKSMIARYKKGLTITEIAKQLGVSRTSVSRVVKNNK